MTLNLKLAQLRTLSNFFNDLAKGLALAVVLGQGSLEKLDQVGKFIASTSWLALSLLSLAVAIFFSHYDR